MSVPQEEVSIWNRTFQSVLKSIFFFNFVVPAGLTNLNIIDFYFLKKKKKKNLFFIFLYILKIQWLKMVIIVPSSHYNLSLRA